MSNLFENFNFSIEQYIDNINNIEKLNKINTYLNFALKVTILNQDSNYNLEIQKLCSKQLLLNYILGDKNSFSKGYNIRNNINKLPQNSIINLLIKSAVEKDCYDRNIIHTLDNTIFNMMSTDLYLGKYEEIINRLSNNTNYLIEIIDNYIELKYQKDNIFNSRLEIMCMNDTLSSNALNQLNLNMNLYEQKNKTN